MDPFIWVVTYKGQEIGYGITKKQAFTRAKQWERDIETRKRGSDYSEEPIEFFQVTKRIIKVTSI